MIHCGDLEAQAAQDRGAKRRNRRGIANTGFMVKRDGMYD